MNRFSVLVDDGNVKITHIPKAVTFSGVARPINHDGCYIDECPIPHGCWSMIHAKKETPRYLKTQYRNLR